MAEGPEPDGMAAKEAAEEDPAQPTPEGPGAPAKDEEMGIEQMLAVSNWRKMYSRYRKRFGRGWRLYRQSPSGMIGLGIMVGFVVLAVFAPLFTPYDVDFIAPSEDVFTADKVELPIPVNESINLTDPGSMTWKAPIGVSDVDRLIQIMTYSEDGYAVKYGVKARALPDGGIGIDIISNDTRRIPLGIETMVPVRFMGELLFAVANSSFYELNPATMAVRREWGMGFHPLFYSNLWNRFVQSEGTGNLYYVMANETMLALYSKVPPNKSYGEFNAKTFQVVKDLFDYNETRFAEIIGEPIVLDVPLVANGSLVVVPTNKGIVAFRLVITRTFGLITDVTIGGVVWSVTYDELADVYQRPVHPILDRPISIGKANPSEALGKERIILAASDGYLYALLRNNGSLNWSMRLITSEIRAPRPTGIYPTPRDYMIVTGITEGRGFIMEVDYDRGVIMGNVSTALRALTFPTPVIGRPDYSPTSHHWIFTTEAGSIFIVWGDNMTLAATFTVHSGSSTSAEYVGNILNNVGTVQGNYFALITREGTIYIQTVTGTYVAPLKPGVYASGNRYLLGTDTFGGDIWTQLLYATRTELVVGLVAAFISVVLGTLVGLVAGYYGGWIDVLLMRLTDIFLTLPILVVALLLAAVLGPSIGNIILIIAIFSWAGVARVIRAQTMSLKNRSFIDAARVSGASNRTIIFRHLAPNVLPLTFLYMVFTISGAIITEAILAFLGMGDPTAVTWGMMLQYLQISGNTLSAPWWLLPPGICITLLSLSFYMIGRAFDEVVNPRLRAR